MYHEWTNKDGHSKSLCGIQEQGGDVCDDRKTYGQTTSKYSLEDNGQEWQKTKRNGDNWNSTELNIMTSKIPTSKSINVLKIKRLMLLVI